nr:glycosyltransferase family 2 protein [Lachnospiraceae bacterium]
MAFISVIIPCYNAENFIDRCMETIVSQTIGIENLEVILVDDASTDHTLDKLKAWERRYPDNVLVITYEENLRQGGARNIGLQYAAADYIGFVDADDWLEPSMYEKLYAYAKEEAYDMVQGKFIREHHVGEYPVDNSRRRDVAYHFEKKQDFYVWDVSDVGDTGEFGSLCCTLLKKSLITEHNLHFPEHVAYEDNYWAAMLHLYVKDLYILDEIVYHYFMNMHSTVSAQNALHQLDRLAVEVMVVEQYKSRGAFDTFRYKLERDFIQRFYLNTLFIIFTRFQELPNIFDYM